MCPSKAQVLSRLCFAQPLALPGIKHLINTQEEKKNSVSLKINN